MELAIDFGTSTTKIATLRDGHFISLTSPQQPVPSAVAYSSAVGKLYFGPQALRLQEEGLVSFPFWKLELKRNPGFRLGCFSLPEILRQFFLYLRDTTILPGEADPTAVTLAVPNYFGLKARRYLIEAARYAFGNPEVHILPEPLAALLGYNACCTPPLQGDILCIDIGAGTCDFSFLSAREAGQQLTLESQAQLGHDAFSGAEVDRWIVKNLLWPYFSMQSGTPAPSNLLLEKNLDGHSHYYLNRQLQAAERFKLELSQTGEAYLNLPDFWQGWSLQCSLDRPGLVEVILPLLQRFRNFFQESIRQEARRLGFLEGGQWRLEAVLLLGGASQTPGLKDTLHQLCPGVPIVQPGELDLNVVRGLLAWSTRQHQQKHTARSIYPFTFYIQSRESNSGAMVMERIPFDLANLGIDVQGKIPIFSIPVHSHYNLATDPEYFECRIYEVSRNSEDPSPHHFLGRDLILHLELPLAHLPEYLHLYLDLGKSILETSLLEQEGPHAFHRTVPDLVEKTRKQWLASSTLFRPYPYLNPHLQEDYQAHLQSLCSENPESLEETYHTSLYRVLMLLQFWSGKHPRR